MNENGKDPNPSALSVPVTTLSKSLPVSIMIMLTGCLTSELEPNIVAVQTGVPLKGGANVIT
jgi:hypothetical protein